MAIHSAPATSAARVRSAAPTFIVGDVGATAEWYVQRLGFILSGVFPTDPPFGFASLQLGGAELMLLRLAGYRKPDLSAQRPEGVWDAYLRVEGVAQLYSSLAGSDCVAMPLVQQSYGDWEFAVRDPNGYVIVFGGT